MRGLANEKKRRIIFNKCRKRGDIILLQETHSNINRQQIWEHEWGGKILFSHGKNDARGVAMLFGKNVDYRIIKFRTDVEGRYLIAELKLEELICTIVNVYAPNLDKPVFFEQLHKDLAEYSENKILAGDFNLTMNPTIDRLNTYQNNNKSLSVLNKIIDHYYLQDSWRARNESNKEYSWYKISRNKQEIKASRIDMAFCSMGLNIENITYFPATFTDHRALFISVKCTQGKTRGPGYWKFNCLLLRNKEFVDFLNKNCLF